MPPREKSTARDQWMETQRQEEARQIKAHGLYMAMSQTDKYLVNYRVASGETYFDAVKAVASKPGSFTTDPQGPIHQLNAPHPATRSRAAAALTKKATEVEASRKKPGFFEALFIGETE